MNDASGFHEHQPVAAPDRTESVRDDDGCTLASNSFDGLDDLLLRLPVERLGRFVENEDLRLEVECPGDADALPLAAR